MLVWSESVDFGVELNLIVSLVLMLFWLRTSNVFKFKVLMTGDFSTYLYLVSYALLLLIDNIKLIALWMVLIPGFWCYKKFWWKGMRLNWKGMARKNVQKKALKYL